MSLCDDSCAPPSTVLRALPVYGFFILGYIALHYPSGNLAFYGSMSLLWNNYIFFFPFGLLQCLASTSEHFLGEALSVHAYTDLRMAM